MSSDTPSDLNSDSSSDSPDTPTTGFATVSKRMRGWSSNLIASGLVLVIALTFGKQMLGWWRTAGQDSPTEISNTDLSNTDASERGGKGDVPTAPTVTPGSRSLGLLGNKHQMQFNPAAGNLGRVSWTGNAASAMTQLGKEAVKAMSSLESTIDSAPRASISLTPAQQRLLKDLRERTPVATTPGGGKIYELPGPLPLVVGIQAGKNSEEAISPHPSVVFWGLAAPIKSSENSAIKRWTLFTYTPNHQTTLTNHNNEVGAGSYLPPLSLPNYMQISMSITAVDEVSMLGLHGPAPLHRWRSYFETALPDAGYEPEGEWRESARMESRRFIKRGDVQKFCDVQLVTVQTETSEEKVQAMLTAAPLLSAINAPKESP